MSELLTIIDRMKFLRDQVLHLNQRDFAARISVSGGLIGQIETGKIGVSPKLLRTLEERFNVSREWLESGVEPMFQTLQAGFAGRHGRVEPPDYTRPGHGDLRFRDNDYVFIRRVDLSVSAGNGTSDVEGPDTGSVALPTSWCSRAGINSDEIGRASCRERVSSKV